MFIQCPNSLQNLLILQEAETELNPIAVSINFFCNFNCVPFNQSANLNPDFWIGNPTFHSVKEKTNVQVFNVSKSVSEGSVLIDPEDCKFTYVTRGGLSVNFNSLRYFAPLELVFKDKDLN